MYKTLIAVMITLQFATMASAQNACGVKASFTPGNDTTLYTGQAITFINTSTNADSYEWLVDTYWEFYTPNLTNYVPPVGITPIKLVAIKGNCTDTAVTYIVRNGTPPVDEKHMNTSYGLPNVNSYASCMVAAKTDGYLLAGVSGQTDPGGYTSPYLVRVSESGCIIWSKTLPIGIKTSVRALITTYDSGFVFQVFFPEDQDKIYMIKLDKNGNILWVHYYQAENGINWIGTVKEMADHSLMILSGLYAGSNFVLTHLNAQGGFLWQKNYYVAPDDEAFFSDLVEKNGFAWIAGNYYQAIDPTRNQWKEFPMLFKVDSQTGDLIWSKGYESSNKFYSWSGIHFYKDGLIMNGFADSLVAPVNAGYSNFQSLLETDLDGNIREGKLIYNPTELDAPAGNNLVVDENNALQLFYSGSQSISLQPLHADYSYFLRLDPNKNIIWQNYYGGYTLGFQVQGVPTPFKGLAMLGQKISPLFSAVYGLSEHLLLLKVDSNGTGPNAFCDIYQTQSTIQDMPVNLYSPGVPVVTNQTLQVTNPLLSVTRLNSELRYNCDEYVPLCAYMKLSGPATVCNMKDTFDFIAHKDPICNDPVIWTYDAAHIKTAYQDGGKLRLIFSAPGIYKIRAEKPIPCNSILDSIIVTVASGLTDFNLGADTALCTGDSITLRPIGKYFSYQWQDGSTNDSFKVKTTGDYHLMVTDSCGNPKSDTIHVEFRTTLPLDLGGPRFKCISDSVTLTPPLGFLQYDWSPDYHIRHNTDGSVVVNPSMDTTYQLVVHDNAGCMGKTQIKISNYPVSGFNLGNDTSICAGGVMGFSAGTGFSSYAWSNGAQSNFIIVKDAGEYSVLVTDQNGCKLYDTVTLTVFPTPVVQISGIEVVCRGGSGMLDAGAGFAEYVWQNGLHSEFYNVLDTGFYKVQVTDQHQCSAADSIHIAQYAEAPHDFLPADTTVCSYTGLFLKPKGDYVQYNWSHGETSSSILAKEAGDYYCQVTDQQGCTGSDSIHILLKDCEALLVFPNAFTPNNDGLNDVFRLKYPGHVADYHLQIFNRWGQMIFETADPSAGWDGTLHSQVQPEGTYVWMLKYTDHSGKKQNMQGSVVLMR